MRLANSRLLATCVLLASSAPAYAYIDPGTGSALIQGLIAAIAALGVTLKLYWHRITGVFRTKKEEEEKDSVPNPTSGE